MKDEKEIKENPAHRGAKLDRAALRQVTGGIMVFQGCENGEHVWKTVPGGKQCIYCNKTIWD